MMRATRPGGSKCFMVRRQHAKWTMHFVTLQVEPKGMIRIASHYHRSVFSHGSCRLGARQCQSDPLVGLALMQRDRGKGTTRSPTLMRERNLENTSLASEDCTPHVHHTSPDCLQSHTAIRCSIIGITQTYRKEILHEMYNCNPFIMLHRQSLPQTGNLQRALRSYHTQSKLRLLLVLGSQGLPTGIKIGRC